MPQETNLNRSPYYDDFDPENNYYKVLFKPAYPVQARELNTIQSTLQNQIEQFGNHIFKEGSVVIPGQLNYNDNFFAVEVEKTFSNIPLDVYAEDLVGKLIQGETSKVKAKIVKVLDYTYSDRDYYTFYISYLSSGVDNQTGFNDSEYLLIEEDVLGEKITIQSGQAFAVTANSSCNSVGSAVILSQGVYFIRGFFVNVDSQLLILDPHTNTPNYKVGFDIIEEVVTADDDITLTDNAKGFNNYAAPGADRFKITAVLSKKPLTETNNENFIQLMEIVNGKIKSIKQNPEYNILQKELARRTYDESGDYYVNPFSVNVKESLNDFKGNGGIFNENTLTYNGNTPSDNLGTYQISPGKAFVRGYEVDIPGVNYIDFEKPRTKNTVKSQSLNYYTGPTISVNRVYGSPRIGLSTSFYVSLRSDRIGSTITTSAGTEIGVARVYDFNLTAGNGNSLTDSYDLSLFDIQTHTEIYLNQPITLTVPTQIKGNSSGATAYLRNSVSNVGIVTVYNVKGKFSVGETFSFNGISSTGISTSINSYNFSDVKSVYGVVGTASTFNCDIVQTKNQFINSITIESSGSVYSPTTVLSNIMRVGDIVSYTKPSSTLPTYSKVTSVGINIATIAAVTSVSGVNDGTLPGSTINPTDFSILTTKFKRSEDNTLYTTLSKSNISDLDLTDSQLTIKKEYTVQISSNAISPISSDTDEFFLPFEEDRYILTRSNGVNEELTYDKFFISNDGKTLEIRGLGSNDNASRLIVTLRKVNITSKQKIKNKVGSLVISNSKYNASGVGTTTFNDGLSYGNYPYGTRVQDEEICLLRPDVRKIHAIFESNNTNDPVLPSVTLSQLTGPNARVTDILVGDEFVGETSHAIGIYCEKNNDLQIGYVYLNNNSFIIGEKVTFKSSKVSGIVQSLTPGSDNVVNNYTLDQNITETIYDYSKIVRKPNYKEPTRRLKVIFEYSNYSTSDTGDITTVNSYNQFDYSELKFSESDTIDIRPRVSDAQVSINSRSPFEFLGRSYNSYSNSAKNILASNEQITLDYSYYLPRIDRIFLTNSGILQLINGQPSDNPELPKSIDDGMEIASVYLPAYLKTTSEAKINILEHKRYTMKDIFSLENRIKNLEYYTSLSLLESKTENLNIVDSNGLNRFKSGFIVDNFTGTIPQDKSTIIKNSIDIANQELRPTHSTTELDLLIGSKSILGIGTTANTFADSRYVNDYIGNNVKIAGRVAILDYDHTLEISQPYATRVENVTPYLVTIYNGSIELEPTSDVWIDTVRLNANVTEIDNFTPTQQQLIASGFDPQTGFGPITWNSWETNWTGRDVSNSTAISGRHVVSVNTETLTGTQSRTGTRQVVSQEISTRSQGDSIVSTELVPYMRSRNIEIVGKRFKPYTRLYSFFDGLNVNELVFPKLLEISMTSGTFTPGETVVAYDGSNKVAVFRIAKSNHKYGPIDAPTDVYTKNPYDSTQTIPENYSSTSSILNIDTFSLSEKSRGDYYGNLSLNSVLIGLTSKAKANVSNIRLLTDSVGTAIGSFFIPNPNESSYKFEVGTKVFKLTNDQQNSNIYGISNTSGEEKFYAQGTINNVQEKIISVRSPRVETINLTETVNVSQTNTSVNAFNLPGRFVDPLAQSFYNDNQNGIFITKLDIFVQSKDSTIPLIVQLRPMAYGVPTEEVIPFSEVELKPDQINVSDDASVPTTVEFETPIYIPGNTYTSIVLLSNSNEYNVWISRLGEIDVTSSLGLESQQIVVTQQSILGSLFKSQNGSTWNPSQYEDLKFNLYRAEFKSNTGDITFYNPDLSLGNDQVSTLLKDSIQVNSKIIRLGLTTSITDAGLRPGNTIVQYSTNATGNYVGSAGSISNLQILNAGIGYTPSSGSATFNGITINSITGRGKNATANVTVNNGSVSAISIVNGGSGYLVGDVIGIGPIGVSSLGRNFRASVSQLGSYNQILVSQVQKDFEPGVGKTIQYYNSSNVLTNLNGGGVLVGSIENNTPYNDGLHLKINHKNHGMHSNVNIVKLSDVQSNLPFTKLTNSYLTTSTDNIALDDTSTANFARFENDLVSVSNPGYILIGDEIISYTGVSGTLLTGITRNIDQTNSFNYDAQQVVYKYELAGVSLRRINTTHSLSNINIFPESIGLDHYYVKLDMSKNGKSRVNDLYLNIDGSFGGSNIHATKNIPYEIIRPIVKTSSVTGTSINAQVRTVSGRSIDGTENSFNDMGYESVNLNSNNYLSTPRIVASKINEQQNLQNLPGNKSFTFNVSLNTADRKLSPVIDLQRVGMIFITNRVNNVIKDYVLDGRVSNLNDDPSAFVYATKIIQLEVPATSLKILVSAYVNNYNDLRALYSISNENESSIYYPFPNQDSIADGSSINSQSKDNNLKFLSYDLKFKEYEFFVDNLPAFRYCSIKLIGTSTNQVYPPRIKDFRGIALA